MHLFREANITHTSCLRSYLNFLHALFKSIYLSCTFFWEAKKTNKNIQYTCFWKGHVLLKVAYQMVLVYKEPLSIKSVLETCVPFTCWSKTNFLFWCLFNMLYGNTKEKYRGRCIYQNVSPIMGLSSSFYDQFSTSQSDFPKENTCYMFSKKVYLQTYRGA